MANKAWNIYNFRLLLADYLKSNGYDVIAVCPNDEFVPEFKNRFEKVIILNKLSRKGKNPFKEIALLNELKKIYSKESIDAVIHFTIKPNIYGSLAAGQLKIPSIAVVTGLGYTFANKGLTSKIAQALYKRAFKANCFTVFQNTDDKDLFIKKKLVSTNKARVILGSGIDTEYFSAQPYPPTSPFKILFVGRLLRDKGLTELISAFKQLLDSNDNVELHIVGDVDEGNPNSYKKSDLKEWFINEKIISHGQLKDPREIMSQSNLVVLPSYREGLPRVILEALAMAKPIIVTDVAGCRETIVNGKNGLLATPRDVESLLHCLTEMCNKSDKKLTDMGRIGRELAVEKFDGKIINAQYLNLVHSILN